MKSAPVAVDYRIKETDLNGYGLLHGGRLLTLADETGYLAAMQHSCMDCLTVGVHQVAFHNPAQLDDDIRIKAWLGLTGSSSMWVLVEACLAGSALLMDGVFVYAAVDRERKSRRVPPFVPASADEQALMHRLQKIRNTAKGNAR